MTRRKTLQELVWVDSEFECARLIGESLSGLPSNLIEFEEHPRIMGYPRPNNTDPPFFRDNCRIVVTGNAGKIKIYKKHIELKIGNEYQVAKINIPNRAKELQISRPCEEGCYVEFEYKGIEYIISQ